MNELDTILDAEADGSSAAFRTSNGHCKIFPDRIELVKSNDDVSGFLTSSYFIFRVAIIIFLFAFIAYREVYHPSGFNRNYYIYLIPLIFLAFSLFGNINVFFYRLRAILFILFVLFFAYWDWRRGNTNGAILYLIFGVMLVSGLLRSFDYSYVSVIYRSDIVQVKFINSIPYLTSAYFLISFRNERGKAKKRPVMLPGAFRKGEQEKKIAYALMKQEGLVS